MTRWLSSLMAALLRREEPDYVARMKQLWRVPPDWQHRPTARVVRKPRIVKSSHERRSA